MDGVVTGTHDRPNLAVDAVMDVCDVEAPEKAGGEVENVATEVVAKPRLQRPGEPPPGGSATRQERIEHDAVVPVRLLHEPVEVLRPLHLHPPPPPGLATSDRNPTTSSEKGRTLRVPRPVRPLDHRLGLLPRSSSSRSA
ncbi:hypothetical protein B296_00026307 [Ensete ventricosum]|uniref:Uncharacterized protein n=1 Tax=Ensete ventricosum TaxID=4639 RepID=A0A427A4P6_ENSVE|nr:hypothetical protein B296_00026307 [Ensete ventricosum]